MNIFLVGPMGSGKSSLGKKLAKSLDKKFIDTDKEIEKKEKKTINEIFENNGEKYFREKEKEFLINISNSCWKRGSRRCSRAHDSCWCSSKSSW